MRAKNKTDILSLIVTHKRTEVSCNRKMLSKEKLKREAAKPREIRSFIDGLKAPGPYGVNIIAEVKRASPSKGIIDAKLNVVTYAKQCEQGGAAALSVLTDQLYFQGSFQDLRLARVATILPVLRKDFLIDEYQVYESAALGADALLLIVRILSPAKLKDLLTLTHDLGMEALVEVHDEKEAEVAGKIGARLVGINNRDLKTFDTDIETAVRICSCLDEDQVPVALSGIFSRQDILKTAEAGIFNFLIGESIVRSDNPRETIGKYLGKAVA